MRSLNHLLTLLGLLATATIATTPAHQLAARQSTSDNFIPSGQINFVGCVSNKTFSNTVSKGGHANGTLDSCQRGQPKQLTHQSDYYTCASHCLNLVPQSNSGYPPISVYGSPFTYSYFHNNPNITNNCYCSVKQSPSAGSIVEGIDAFGDCASDQATVTYLHLSENFLWCVNSVLPAYDNQRSYLNIGPSSDIANCANVCTNTHSYISMGVEIFHDNHTKSTSYNCTCYDTSAPGGDFVNCGPKSIFFFIS